MGLGWISSSSSSFSSISLPREGTIRSFGLGRLGGTRSGCFFSVVLLQKEKRALFLRVPGDLLLVACQRMVLWRESIDRSAFMLLYRQ